MKYHIVFFVGKLETMDYFVHSICAHAAALGFDYYLADVNDPVSYSSDEFYNYLQQPNTFAFLLNQIGLGLFKDGENVYSAYDVPVIDFIQDHPRNYDDTLLNPATNVNAIVLDKSHERFIRDFYHEIKNITFMPNGGTETAYSMPYEDRDIDVLYTGSNQPKVTSFPVIPELADKCQLFYNTTVALMLGDPTYATQDAIYEVVCSLDDPSLLREETLLMLNLTAAPYIEAAVRREFKLKTVYALDQKGISVDIYGENWISEKYPFSDNIRIHSRVSSDECNRLVGRSKISLNCMPWYKEGCSERVFNNMLNGAVCVTDVSTYLLERFEHGRELIFYNLEDLDSMADCVKYLLENPVVAKGIAKQGQLNALRNDTWRSRAKTILEYADSIMI